MRETTARWVTLFLVATTTLMSSLDGSIVAVALPTMAKNLHASTAATNWVVTGYLIAITAVIIIAGRLGDIWGNKRVFRVGVMVFTAASLLCGISVNLPMLIGARVLQALGASCAMGTSQGIITRAFPPNQRGRALGLNGTFVALGSMSGPPLGGVITQLASWHYIFWINVPIGVAAIALGFVFLREDERRPDEKMDGRGALLLTPAIFLLCGAINLMQIPILASAAAQNLILAGVCILAVGLLWLYVRHALKAPQPLLDVNIFRNPMFSMSILCAFLYFIAINSYGILFPYYLQTQLGLPELTAGLCMAANPVLLGILAPISGHISDKLGQLPLSLTGLSVAAVGLGLQATTGLSTPLALAVTFACLLALGGALFNSPNTSLIMSTVPGEQVGVAGSVNALVRNLGMTTGTLLATTISFAVMGYLRHGPTRGLTVSKPDPAFIVGMRWAYGAGSFVCLLGMGLTVLRVRRKRQDNRGKKQEETGETAAGAE